MNKKAIVLADNSYTIRRIVELSFSEIENIEVRSFENGSGIKEKLLQLKPAVVIVDIKLPETNGYDICRFINDTPTLNQCRVFLMKGSFEPVDNEMIKNLKYEDIVTKPFDSNALVSAVMKIVNGEEIKVPSKVAGAGPSSFPEDFPEIEPNAPDSEDISFSDIRGEMEAQLPADRPTARNQVLERDEVLPSEEITQGTQPLKDNLMPIESEENIKNPFEEEPAFEEINAANSGTAASIAPEFDTKSVLKTPQVDTQTKDASDEFHERFLEIAKEDTSEDLLKASLESSQMPDSDDLQFPSDQKDDKLMESGEKIALEFDKSELNSPAKTIYASPDSIIDLMVPGQKPEKDSKLFEDKVFEKETVVKKAQPEASSPEAELEKLVKMPKKETRLEAEAPLPEKLAMTGKLEEKLSLTIKELLWEIVPPLAEKIIKDEIDKIKSDLSKSGL
ncbi:MAG: response regulator [Chrysiogenales bacterium]|nr:MAG: response regulator [Chrysiogenales bacterium]